MMEMEGLIPFIYKAIKERRRRSYKRCSSAAFGARAVHDYDVSWEEPAARTEAGDHAKFGAERGTAHRRHRSLEELAGEVGSSPKWRPGAKRRSGSSPASATCDVRTMCCRRQLAGAKSAYAGGFN
jgi:hypothetical protein